MSFCLLSPLPNRMWAGGRLEFLAPMIIGSSVQRTSTIQKVAHKQGRSGDLVFITMLHELASSDGQLLICEEHDIVYKEATPTTKKSAAPEILTSAPHTASCTPTSTTLFRYSALIFNGHRIHYDANYCRNVKGYANLVINGPLNATMLAGFARTIGGGELARFSYRGLAPALLGTTITLHAKVTGNQVDLMPTLDDGIPSMQARALLTPVDTPSGVSPHHQPQGSAP